LHSCANPCNTLFITRNEQISGSSPLVGSLFSLDLQEKLGKGDSCSSEPLAF
jgi:hypothetical protein